MQENVEKQPPKWYHPMEVMKIHQLKKKKKALQARINGNALNNTFVPISDKTSVFDDVLTAKKRKNPFIKDSDTKRRKPEAPILDESCDQTLFKLLHEDRTVQNSSETAPTTFSEALDRAKQDEVVEVVKGQDETWFPIDWALKSKARLWSKTPFPWNQKLKMSEEASGITAFTRCLSNNDTTTLDTAPNALFHQCCLYWQHPSLPWLSLFPRAAGKVSDSQSSVAVSNPKIRASLQTAWSDSFRSLFQLLRTKQCPYFYLCANNFSILFRAAGICGFSDVHAIVTPTTRGFRQALRQEDVEFRMPLRGNRLSDLGYETQDGEQNADEEHNEEWLKEMGISAEDIKKINYTQAKLTHKVECEVDNSEQSLILVEGVEINGFYNFLLNCKSATSQTGPLAGIPPTLLAPVAFNGATLNSLKIRESKVQLDDAKYFSLEISGPILPSTVHNLFMINDNNMSATFTSLPQTDAFSKIQMNETNSNLIFEKENLSDCGLNKKIVRQFCMANEKYVGKVECLKFNCDNKTFTWT